MLDKLIEILKALRKFNKLDWIGLASGLILIVTGTVLIGLHDNIVIGAVIGMPLMVLAVGIPIYLYVVRESKQKRQ